MLSLLSSISYAAEPVTKQATTNKSSANQATGIDRQYIDPAVRAQDDFFRHFNGKWLATVEIPAEKSSWGAGAMLYDDIQPKLRKIIETAAAKKSTANAADAQKIGDFYLSFMDEKKLEALGTKPLMADFAKVEALKESQDIPALIGYLNRKGINAPYTFGIHQDNKDSTKYVADLYQTGLNMPDRDYYLNNEDQKLVQIRAKYLTHIETMLSMLGDKDAKAKAAQILAIETSLAKAQWTKVELRDPVKAYNKVEVTKLPQLVEDFNWAAYLQQTGLVGKTDYLIVSQPSYLQGVGKLLQEQPLAAWKAYFQWQVLKSNADYLSAKFSAENFAFNATTLSGVKEQRPRWKRAVETTEGALGESIGKIYVEQHFPAERKAKMEVLVKNLLAAFKQGIDGLEWMGPSTKKEAHDKLSKFMPKIGYPNKWRSYDALTIKADDLLGNIRRSTEFEYLFALNKLGKPIDREEWGMTPQTVNAYYNPEMNEIVFPASMLQPPFFNADADDAVNYGAIGAVIGHEISHGFDDQGSQYDGNGNLRNWWTEQDNKNFSAKSKMLVEQYNAYSPIAGYHINGELTLGENIADNSGLAVAYQAYKISLGGKPAPVLNGMTGAQRFYSGFAQVWRGKMRDQRMIAYLKSDPHSPAEFRANGTLKNQPGFYEAFGVKEGDKMYLAPNKRVIMW